MAREVPQRGDQDFGPGYQSQGIAAARNMNIDEEKFKASPSWVHKYKNRHSIRNGTCERKEFNADDFFNAPDHCVDELRVISEASSGLL